VGIDLLILTLPCAFSYIRGIVGSKQPKDQPYAYSYARLIPQLTYGLDRISGLSGASFSNYSGYGVYNGGPLIGTK
jgi:hypothetical protein